MLKSLQDLIHNDLLRGAGSSPAAAKRDTTVPAETTPAAPASTTLPADMPFGSVVKSLEELVAKDLAVTDDEATPSSAPAAGDIGQPAPDVPATSGDAPAAAATEGQSAVKKKDVTQQAFTFDGWDAPATGLPAGEAEMLEADVVDFDVETPATDAEPPQPPDLDIPVLTEPVPPSRFTADDIPVLQDVAAPGPLSAAHDIAERVVAGLNAERHARGEPALDDGVLEALRTLLREELERNPPE
ncbi:MAG: hypothetical protein A2V91_06405 [Candidatus Muproteobacteria bacterium RBG_16_64_10]|uniref:Uncharacterized protein n=1 Tax=Candidatus Muproteobacteria bacterium RBG_16_64_10 TaxID=1817757 RepID=A0A1F6T192_9PROT|nr:MAG: hypothetical protein A2V91_06405 [Candidatus Muproteobacteria bacterium RBG_16_64_10]